MTTSATSSHPSEAPDEAPPRQAFVTTHWSVVLMAGRNDTPRACVALEKLCQSYWPPLYAYVRRRGYSPEDAQDLTQAFFARLLERESVAGVVPGKGRFRSFLLTSLNHFLADEWSRACAQKRGGGQVFSIDWQSAETQLGEMPVERFTPERAYDHRWAMTLLAQVYQRLEEEHRVAGKAAVFEVLSVALAGKSQAAPYASLAEQLGWSVGTVKVAVHRLRQRYRVLLREIIADTVSSPDEVEDELRHLFAVLAG